MPYDKGESREPSAMPIPADTTGKPATTDNSNTPPHILVVDDDQQIRETVRFLLEDAGYTVEEAVDGAEALALLRSSAQPLVALLDNLMPRINGVGVLDAVVANDTLRRRHAYLLITASPRSVPPETLAQLELLSGALIRKPFDISTLLDAVAEAQQRLSSAG